MIRKFTATIYITAILSLIPDSTLARPYKPEIGVCYYFKNRDLQYLRPCVVSAGYGAGAHYATLTWADGSETSIFKKNYCPAQNFDQYGFCSYTVNEQAANRFNLDIFLQFSEQALRAEDRAAECYELNNGIAFCYGL